jgi:predicted amino acid-binding ACT domain protein
LDGTPFCNDTITDAILDVKLVEHRAKMTTSMKESILETRYALGKLIQSLLESAAKPQASITLQLDKLAAQLAGVNQTLSTSTITTDMLVHLQETLQTAVALIADIKDNLEHLQLKIDGLKNTIDKCSTFVDHLGHLPTS